MSSTAIIATFVVGFRHNAIRLSARVLKFPGESSISMKNTGRRIVVVRNFNLAMCRSISPLLSKCGTPVAVSAAATEL
jgi:hypothetical protein